MKRILPGVLLTLAMLISCSPKVLPSDFSDSEDAVTTTAPATTVSGTTTLLPNTDEPPLTDEPAVTSPGTTAPIPGTTAPATTAPPPETTLPAPSFVNVDLDSVDRDNRSIVYTATKAVLYDEEGAAAMEMAAGRTLIALERTAEYAVILYQNALYLTHPDGLTDEVPADAKALQDSLGGIYYPGSELLVAIDAGHQGKGMKEKEPLGPGSTEMKAMLSTGTAGVSTRIAERELNLRVSLLLRDELISRGYSVMMIRESHEVTISNAQRAQIANAYGADAFVRIHANGSENRDVRGAMTICQTPHNPYNGEGHTASRRLSDCILEKFCAVTGIKQNNVWETDTMTGINWAEVPVTIVEMGYMSNAKEDELMATDAFRKNAAVGMADGLDAFFELDVEN